MDLNKTYITGDMTIGSYINNLDERSLIDLINYAMDQYFYSERIIEPDYEKRPELVRLSWLIEPYENHNSLAETSENVIKLAKLGLIYPHKILNTDNLFFTSIPIESEYIIEAMNYFENIDCENTPGTMYVTQDRKYRISLD